MRLMWLILLFAVSAATITLEEYEEMIETQISLAQNFTFDTNSFSSQPTDKTDLEFGTYDFIIVGIGASGAVLVNRLSEVRKWKILALEAGPFPGKYTRIPAMAPVTQLSKLNWGYMSVPQKKCCLDLVDQRCRIYRGKTIGGSSIFNGLVYARGPKESYDEWNKTCPGWSYEDVLRYFKKSEGLIRMRTEAPIEKKYHGTRGPLTVETRIPLNPLLKYWYEANTEKGIKILDVNGESMLGTTASPMMTNFGKRQDTGSAYITKSVKERSNLNISTESYVTQVLLDGTNKAIGVRFALNNRYYIAKATKEVILSAGAIGSPQILMNSGIGPKQHLDDVQIPVVQDLPVGSTLRNHIAYAGLYFSSNHSIINDSLTQYIKDYMKTYGTLTIPGENTAIGFYQTKLSKPGNVDIEIMFYANDGIVNYFKDALSGTKVKSFQHLNSRGINLFVGTQRTASVGSVRLKNNNPFEYPLIDPNYFSDPNNTDMERLYESIQLALDIMLNTTAFQAINTTLIKQNLPDCDKYDYLSKNYWMCMILYFSIDIYHPLGTCPMSQNSTTGVVDKNCKVFGIQNLRVVDASIYPMVFPGHPVAQCVMIAEKISDVIKDDHPHFFL